MMEALVPADSHPPPTMTFLHGRGTKFGVATPIVSCVSLSAAETSISRAIQDDAKALNAVEMLVRRLG